MAILGGPGLVGGWDKDGKWVSRPYGGHRPIERRGAPRPSHMTESEHAASELERAIREGHPEHVVSQAREDFKDAVRAAEDRRQRG